MHILIKTKKVLSKKEKIKIAICLLAIFLILLISFTTFLSPSAFLKSNFKEVFQNLIEAYKEKNIEKLAASFFPIGSANYYKLIEGESDFFDAKLEEALENAISFKIYREEIWRQKDNAGTMVHILYRDDNANEIQEKFDIGFVRIDGNWYLNYNYHINTEGYPNISPISLRITDSSILSYTVKETDHIDYESFRECENLLEVTLPENFNYFDHGWFNNNHNLISINVAQSSTYYSSVDGVLYNKDKTVLIYYPIGKIQVANSTNGIFTIPNTVHTVEDRAFHMTRGLREITIPSSVKKIGKNAFDRSINLTNVSLSEGLEVIDDFAFYSCEKLLFITLPSSVKSIGMDAFNKCISLENFFISENSNLSNIGYAAFDGCNKLEYIYLPNGIEHIQRWTFQNCHSLKEIRLPENLKIIDMFAFRYCVVLEYLYINKTVVYIGDRAFQTCYKLNLDVEASEKPIGWHNSWDIGIVNPVNWGA